MGLFNFFKSTEEKVQRCFEIEDLIKSITSDINNIKEEHFELKRSHDMRIGILDKKATISKAEERENNEILRKRFEERFLEADAYFEKAIVQKTKDVYKLKAEFSKLFKEKGVNDLYKSEIEKRQIGDSYEVIKQAFVDGKIKKEEFKGLRKKIEGRLKGKVLYADAIVYARNGGILILKRSEGDDSFAGKWCLPGGHVDPGEDCKTAAIRELAEETLIEVLDDSMVTQVAELDKEDVNIKYFQFFVDGVPVPVLNSREHVAYEWVRPQDLDNYDLIGDTMDVLNKVIGYRLNEVEVIRKSEDYVGEITEDPSKHKDKLKGGLADNKTVQSIAKKHNVSVDKIVEQLRMGVRVEMEHTNDIKVSAEIALDHLMESPDYYTLLDEMESKFEKGEKYKIGDISPKTGLKKVAPNKWVDPKTGEEVKDGEEKKKKKNHGEEKPIEQHARSASQKALEAASQSGDEKLRVVAKSELARRQKEESPEEEEETDIKKSLLIKSYALEVLMAAYNNGLLTDDSLIEKSIKGKAGYKKEKRLVNKKGITYYQYFWVKEGVVDEGVEDLSHKEPEKVQEHTSNLEEKLGGEIKNGDSILYWHKGKATKGIVKGFSYDEKGGVFFVGLQNKETGAVNWKKYDSKNFISKENPEDQHPLDPEVKILEVLDADLGKELVLFHGAEFIRKKGASPEHIKNEVASLDILSKMGVRIPKYHFDKENNILYMERVKGTRFCDLEGPQKAGVREDITNFYAAQCLLMNWGSVGDNWGNYVVSDSGVVYLVDAGGAMGFRAKGGEKLDWKDPSDLSAFDTMMSKEKNFQSSHIYFGGYIEKTAGLLTNEALKKEIDKDILRQLKEISKNIDGNPDNLVSPNTKQEDIDIIGKRLDNSLVKYLKLVSDIEYIPSPVELPKILGSETWDKDPYRVENKKGILDLYYKDRRYVSANLGRDDVDQMYQDFADLMAMSKNEEDLADESAGEYSGEEFKKFKKDNGLSNRHINALMEHTTEPENIFRDLFSGKEDFCPDGFNLSLDGGKYDGFSLSKQNIFTKDLSSLGSSELKKRLRAKSLVQAFAIMKSNESPDYKTNKTVYRGMGYNTSKKFESIETTFNSIFKDGNVVINPSVMSCSQEFGSSFDKDIKMVIGSADVIDISKISGFSIEVEAITKPMHIYGITKVVNKGIGGVGSAKTYISANRLGVFPTMFD